MTWLIIIFQSVNHSTDKIFSIDINLQIIDNTYKLGLRLQLELCMSSASYISQNKNIIIWGAFSLVSHEKRNWSVCLLIGAHSVIHEKANIEDTDFKESLMYPVFISS